MNRNSVVLLIGESRPELDRFIQAGKVRMVRVERAATACARMAGGGVDAALFHIPAASPHAGENIAMLRRAAPQVPVLALCDPGDEASGPAAVASGAAGYLPISRCETDLSALLEATFGSGRPAEPAEPAASAKPGAILSLMGTKGGVGTTTLALNTACVLARQHRVILVELRPAFGTLGHYFQTRRFTRSLADALPGLLETCLWPYAGIPGLRVLFAPTAESDAGDFAPERAAAILAGLARMADYVVADLDASLPEASRAAIQRSSVLALVLERDPICLESAKVRLEALDRWNILPQSAGAVVVNRAAVSAPFEPGDVETQLGIPLFGMIPPAPDLCIVARQARVPLVAFDPESLVAGCIDRFAANLRQTPVSL